MKAIKFKARDGQTMFAWATDTDPINVLVELTWAWGAGQSMCDWDCPTKAGGYCLDCHSIAYSARERAKVRLDRAWEVRKARIKAAADERYVEMWAVN